MIWTLVNQHFEWMWITLATYRFAYRPTEHFLVKLSVTMGVVLALKYIIPRERPNRKNKHSFPSGHTALAWFLAWEYQHPLIFGWAAMVAYARVYESYHWWSDVLFSVGWTYWVHNNFLSER